MVEAQQLLKEHLSLRRTTVAPTHSVVVVTLGVGGTVVAVVVADQTEAVAVVAVADQTEVTTTTLNTSSSPTLRKTAPTRDANH